MRLDNGVISERQTFRIALLENITIGMVLIPYITTNVAGEGHMWAFVTGLIFVLLYSFIMYGFSKWLPKGLAQEIDDYMGISGRVLMLIYALRYVLRGAVVLLFFSRVINEYMLRSMNVWVIAVPFALVCGYGAVSNIEKRGRLMELLFWWMLVPLILVAVFSITNVGWNSLADEFLSTPASSGAGIRGILYAAYLMLVVMSGLELMSFTLPMQKENLRGNALKMLVWIVISVMLAYFFVIGILGQAWTGSGATAALNVMEASAFPGGLVERLDYPVLAFWVIGVFAVISGYMFYAKIFTIKLCGRKSVWYIPVIVALVAATAVLLSFEPVGRAVLNYLIWADILISIAAPLLVILIRHVHVRVASLLIIFVLLCTGCRNKYESSSLENRDYATSITVTAGEDDYIFDFTIADLSEYNGDAENILKTSEYSCISSDMSAAIIDYYDNTDRQLDIGHVSELRIYSSDKESLYKLAEELSNLPMIAKSVPVELSGDCERKILLRELIKEAYAWEKS